MRESFHTRWPMKLQEYKGYYVDYRLRQFRSAVPYPEVIEFIDFDSDKGQKLLREMRAEERERSIDGRTVAHYSNMLLQIVDMADEVARGDLQAMIEAQCMLMLSEKA